jgi:hypothetical protein
LLIKSRDKSPLSLKSVERYLSQFGSNPSPRIDLRGVPQLMEKDPQLIPRISKMVMPLNAYIRRHSHGERERIISERYFHFYRGSFEQGVGQGELGEDATSASTLCKNLIFFSLIHVLDRLLKYFVHFQELASLDESIFKLIII